LWSLLNGVPHVGYVVAVSHCILNQTTRWFWKGSGGWVEGFIVKFLERLKPLGIGLYQLPCPEFGFLGNPRKPMTKEEYMSLPGFTDHCRKLAEKAVEDLTAFTRFSVDPKLRVLAVIGVEGSPTCGVYTTSKRTAVGSIRIPGKGIFIEMLEKMLKAKGLDVAFYGLDLKQQDETVARIVKALENQVKDPGLL